MKPEDFESALDILPFGDWAALAHSGVAGGIIVVWIPLVTRINLFILRY